MKTIKYIIFKEGKYYVSQCLNVEVASFGDTIDEATLNLKEALDLYFRLVSLSKSRPYMFSAKGHRPCIFRSQASSGCCFHAIYNPHSTFEPYLESTPWQYDWALCHSKTL